MIVSASASALSAAPAKLNLYLHVLGRRQDGYHELDSLVAFADVADLVTVTESETPSLVIDGPFAQALQGEPVETNLVWRALHALADRLGRAPTVAIRLRKSLPIASGIGGGSADAGACLRALARLWTLDDAGAALADVAKSLGADVPVCLDSRPAYLGGIGETLDAPPRLPDCYAVLVNPGTPVSTPAVFKARVGAFSTSARFSSVPADARALALLLNERGNDLADPAIKVAPVIRDVLTALTDTHGCLLARLSGSGATCFGLYETGARARLAAGQIQGDRPGWWIRTVRFLAAKPEVFTG